MMVKNGKGDLAKLAEWRKRWNFRFGQQAYISITVKLYNCSY